MATSAAHKKLLAEPSGAIVWTPDMQQQLKRSQTHFERAAAGRLAPTLDFASNREACEAVFASRGSYAEAQLHLLQWHGLEALDWILSSVVREGGTSFPLGLLIQIEDARVPAFLASRLSLNGARAALTTLGGRWPLLVARLLLQQQPTRAQLAATLLYELLARYPELQALIEARAGADERVVLGRLTRIEQRPEATAEQLPRILRDPPWRVRKASVVLPELDLTPICEPARIDFPQAEIDRVSELDSCARFRDFLKMLPRHREPGLVDEREIAATIIGVRYSALGKLGDDGPWAAADFGQSEYGPVADALVLLPPSLVRSAFEHLPIRAFGSYYSSAANWWTLLQRYPEPALRSLLRAGATQARTLEHIDSDQAAPGFATNLLRNRWLRGPARAWLLRHPQSAARGLIPHAFGRDAALRAVAQHALHQLADWGAAEALRQQAQRYGAAASAALEQLLGIDPQDLLPAKLPALPKDLYLPVLPRLLLSSAANLAVPIAALPDVLLCMMLCRTDLPYAGLLKLQRALTPDSLAEFACALFKWWLDHEGPAKERWVLDIQGLLGDNQTVAVLNRALLAWRQALNRIRAYDALNLIAQIGTDVALMRLTAWAEHPRYADLASRARKLLTDVAEARGLSLEELSDRSVPDLGLDQSGELRLDYGPRQFTVRLDAQLLPQLQDASGRVLKSLPGATSKDDATLVKEAKAQFTDLKKQARSIASVQVKRLELAMVSGRRWSLAEARTLIFAHPVLRLLASRLVWGVYADVDSAVSASHSGPPVRSGFRLAEDYSLADQQDQALSLSDETVVGLLHPVEADSALLADFSQRLAEYEVLQPFAQLRREVFRLSPALATENRLPQWEGRQLSGGSALGLEQRGWNRRVGDDGYIDHFEKALSGGRAVTLWLSPGWHVAGGSPNDEPHQVLRVCLPKDHCWSQLSAIEFSEMQRDLELVAWHQH